MSSVRVTRHGSGDQTTSSPAPVQVREWTLGGGTLRESGQETTQSATVQPRFVLEDC